MNQLPSHQEHQPAKKGIRRRLAALLTAKTVTAEPAARQEAQTSPERLAAKMRQVEHDLPDAGIHLVLTGEADKIFKTQKERVQRQLLARVAVGDTEELQSIRKGGFTDNSVYALPEALEQRFGKKIAIKELTPEARAAGARGSDLKGQFDAMQFLAAKQAEKYPKGIKGVFRFADVYGYMKQTPTDERPAEECKEWLIMERIEGEHAEGFAHSFDPFGGRKFGGGVQSYIEITGRQSKLSRIASPHWDDDFKNAVEAGQFQDAIAKSLASKDAGVSEIKSMLHDLRADNILVETKPNGTPGFVAIDMGHPDNLRNG